jgi:hypothetical protein
MLDARIVAVNTHGATVGEQGASAFFERITPSSQGIRTT